MSIFKTFFRREPTPSIIERMPPNDRCSYIYQPSAQDVGSLTIYGSRGFSSVGGCILDRRGPQLTVTFRDHSCYIVFGTLEEFSAAIKKETPLQAIPAPDRRLAVA
jgi:hypothetical protein